MDQINPTPVEKHLKRTILSLNHQSKQSAESSPHEDVNKNLADVEDLNKTKKANSWASNYLQSIGHNNKKPIKMNLSLSRNKIQRIETISTKNEISKIPTQSTLYNHTETFSEVFNMTDNSLESSELNNNMIGEHINIGNIKTLYPTVSEVHNAATPAMFKSDDIRALVNSNLIVDTINLNDSDSKPAHATLLAKSSGEAAYCYDERNGEIDILDAIKSKINRENAIERKSRAMNLPTHKDMCEDFIKEISISKSERKVDRSKSSTPSKSKEHGRVHKKKSCTPKLDAKIKNDNKILKESSKIIEKINKEHLKKIKSTVLKTEKAQKKLKEEYKHYKKQQNSKPIIDLKDFDILSKHILDKEIVKQPTSEIHNPERPILKRIRSTSEDIRNSANVISNSSTRIRSVVEVTDNHEINPPKRQCFEENFDLRSKLSRANQRLNKTQENDFNKKPKQRENIKITVESKNDNNQKSPKKSGVKYKTRKCKKLKLIINVVCRESDDETTSSDSCYSDTENSPTHNMDLSFLDDFNVDEIVDSLRHSPKQKIKSPARDSKTGIHTNMPVEQEFKIATILNRLSAKSETNHSFITSVKTECKNEETKEINGATRLNKNEPNPVPEMSSISMKEDSKVNKINVTQNTTHDLVKLLCQTKLQLRQQKSTMPHATFLDANIGGLQSEECNVAVNMNQANEEQSSDNERLIVDESVIIHESEISIIDLTDECAISKTNNIAVSATLNNIQQQMQHNEKKKDDINVKSNPHTFVDVSYKKMEKPNTRHTKYEFETGILKQNDDTVIDLTDDSINVDKEHKTVVSDLVKNIHHTVHAETAKPKNSSSQIDVENYHSVDQAIHWIPLLSVNYNLSNENEKLMKTTVLSSDSEHENNLNIAIPMETDQPMESVQLLTPTNIELVRSDTQIKEIITTKPDTVKDLKTANQAQNVSVSNNTSTKDSSPSGFSNLNILFAQKLLENIIENVWETKNELENISRTKATKIESGKTCEANNDIKEIGKPFHTNENKIEIGNASKTNHTIGNDTTVRLSNSDDLNKELTMKPDSVNSVKQINQTIKTKEEKPKESPQSISGISNTASKSNVIISDSKNMNKVFETKTAMKVLEKVVENVWDHKNELENTPETKDIKKDIGKPTQASGTKTEIGNASKPNIEKKVLDESNLSSHKALAGRLEEKMREYLNKNIKIINHIYRGRFSNIFSCKDSNGQTYAAKVLKKNNVRHAFGIEKVEMIKKLQQDIPRENLNTIYLIDGFEVERCWCFLTEYYPKNLQHVLKYQIKPFHIDRVQDLARQLILAVMVLRNNNVVHSDINPRHILLNATYERLKLCGFDGAYYKTDSVRATPNIGTVAYRAPEIIMGFSAGYSIDVWSSALVIYEMATNTKLFNGIYNNEILYKQMCTFGNLPWDMVESSFYKNRHFQGRIFMRRVGYRGQDAILFGNFFKTKRLRKSLWGGHKKHWPAKVPNVDMKLTALISLLEHMLSMDPRQRLAIEFVCANPFIYEMW